MRIRVLVYNVRNFREGLDRVLHVVRRFEPDAILVNESGRRRRLRRFARELGMAVASDPRSPFRRRVRNAVLARPPWRIVSRRLHRFAGTEPSSPRGALVAQLGRAGRRTWAVSVHLGLRPTERRSEAEELADLVRGLGGPVLIGGDLNEAPDGPAVRFLADRFWDAWLLAGDASGETYPAHDPSARIDYLLVSEGLGVLAAVVPPTPDAGTASDHRPVVADLELREAASPGF